MPLRRALAPSVLALLALVAFFPGCDMRPLTKWVWSGGKLSGPDIPFTCTAPLRGTKIVIDCEALPNDTKISVRGSEHKASGTWHLDIDVGDLLGPLSVKEFFATGFELDPKIPLVITIPQGTVKTELPKIDIAPIRLGKGAGTPMPFGNEATLASNPAGPTLLWLGSESEAFGPATTLREVDWIAVEGVSKISDGPLCKYQDTRTGEVSSVRLNVHATEVVIYDRRTARVVDRNLFKPSVSCPLEKRKDQETVHASVGAYEIKRWLQRWFQERRTQK